MITYLMIRANTSLMSGEELLRLSNVRFDLYPPDVLDRDTMVNRFDRWVPYENEAGDQFSVNCASVKAIEDIDLRYTIDADTGDIVETKEYGVEVTEEWMKSVKGDMDDDKLRILVSMSPSDTIKEWGIKPKASEEI